MDEGQPNPTRNASRSDAAGTLPPEAYFKAAARLERWLKACVLCPRRCGVNRLAGERGFCRAGRLAAVNLAQLHFGEEPPLTGSQGSGAVFFAGCTLACLFCQNHTISQTGWGDELAPDELARVFLGLQKGGAHNLNLVTPTPHLPAILQALGLARERGFSLPVVYNTSGYERPAVIRQLAGLVQIYLPDYKYADDAVAARLSEARNYVMSCREAIREMAEQVGGLELDAAGVARRGLLVRHLVLPQGLAGSHEVLRDLVRVAGRGVWVSLLAQYTPLHQAHTLAELNRPVSLAEYQDAVEALEEAGVEHGFLQGPDAATADYVPPFRETP
ncbi:MAG: radical SAM protein [Deltaproteobacteria bacterium]|nr:radical SAM protein [Deltaproteobacteria bacterium]